MEDRQVRMTPRASATMRTLRLLAGLTAVIVLWLFFLTEVLSALFAEKVIYLSRGAPLQWVTYQEGPTRFVLVVVVSLAGAWLLGRLLLGLIPKKD